MWQGLRRHGETMGRHGSNPHKSLPSSHAAPDPVMAVVAETTSRTPMLQPVLVLNASYEPINVCAARRAIVLVLKGLAMSEEENGHFTCRSEEHTSELQSQSNLVCRLLLEKKKIYMVSITH